MNAPFLTPIVSSGWALQRAQEADAYEAARAAWAMTPDQRTYWESWVSRANARLDAGSWKRVMLERCIRICQAVLDHGGADNCDFQAELYGPLIEAEIAADERAAMGTTYPVRSVA